MTPKRYSDPHSRNICIRSAAGIEPFAQCSKQLCSVSTPSGAVHTGENGRPRRCQTFEHRPAVPRVRVVVHLMAAGFARLKDVGFGQRRMLGPALCEEIAAQEGLCRFLREKAALPGVGKMWGREPADPMLAERQVFAVR
jgi:hypothetical protein